MMSSIALESEDLDYVPVQVVRMEDVQPPREVRVEVLDSSEVEDSGCMINDDDSNIGSMVSIHSEEIVEECGDSIDIIVPQSEPLEEIPIEIEENTTVQVSRPDSWPTLEILPGGVIKHADKTEEDLTVQTNESNTLDGGEMMYACAKCSQSFKYLFCLVKHVKWHEEEEKKHRSPNLAKLSSLERELINVRRERYEFEKSYKKQKVEILGRIAAAIGKIEDAKRIFNT